MNWMAGFALLLIGTVLEAKAADSSSVEVAFVANSEGATVSVFDVAARDIVGAIDVNPKRVKAEGAGRPNYAQDSDVSPDGRTLYVSRGYMGDVAAFDVASGKMLWERSLNTGRADHMTITADGKHLFVSAIYDNRVYKISTAKGEIVGHAVTGIYPHDVKVSKDGKRIYNTSLGQLGSIRPSGAAAKDTPGFPLQITVAEADTLRTTERIKVDHAFRPWQFSADEKFIYAQLSNEHGVAKFDMSSRTIVQRLALPVKSGVTSADWDFEAPHHGLAMTEDGKTLCIAGRASDYTALVDVQSLSLIATIPAGDAPGWSEVSHDGQFCFVTNTRSDELSIVSIPDRREVARLPIGDGPKHITMAKVQPGIISELKNRRNK